METKLCITQCGVFASSYNFYLFMILKLSKDKLYASALRSRKTHESGFYIIFPSCTKRLFSTIKSMIERTWRGNEKSEKIKNELFIKAKLFIKFLMYLDVWTFYIYKKEIKMQISYLSRLRRRKLLKYEMLPWKHFVFCDNLHRNVSIVTLFGLYLINKELSFHFKVWKYL